MSAKEHRKHHDVEACVDSILEGLGKKIVLGMPLGLGKPNHFVNELYRRAVEDSSIDLTICTALSLEKPRWSSELERRFLEPFVERIFGGYVELQYVSDMRDNKLPPNIEIREFYTKAGSYLNLRHAQQNYISSNYTHVYRDLLDSGVNLLGQMVCCAEVDGERRFSLSCNPDVTLDVAKVLERRLARGQRIASVAEINNRLPFMYGDAEVAPEFFTDELDNEAYHTRLFGAPKMAISDADFMIGLWSSALIKDGGTLQIGIGSLGDALVYALQLRHEHNDVYIDALSKVMAIKKFGDTITACGGVAPFEIGLNGCTEMFVDGYLELIRSGIVKRKTYNDVYIQRLLNEGRIKEKVDAHTIDALLDAGAISTTLSPDELTYLREFGVLDPRCHLDNDGATLICGDRRIENDLSTGRNRDELVDNCLGEGLLKGILVHGGFFLGPESFYEELRTMPEEQRRLIFMTSVLKVNQLYENEYASEELKILQRPYGRFVNACLMVTLNGGVVSDGLETGQMVSGVGGQYNFVSQAHALPGGRSILMCRSTRCQGSDVHSNIVFNYGHITVPRHLRDIVITEYGIASLRGRSDAEIIAALLNITDSRFQEPLLRQAKEAGKIADDYRIPDQFRSNVPERLSDSLKPFKEAGYFHPFPFGTDFTAQELEIGKSLKALKSRMSEGFAKVSSIGRAATIMGIPDAARPYLARLDLEEATNAKEKMMRKLVIHALSLGGVIDG